MDNPLHHGARFCLPDFAPPWGKLPRHQGSLHREANPIDTPLPGKAHDHGTDQKREPVAGHAEGIIPASTEADLGLDFDGTKPLG